MASAATVAFQSSQNDLVTLALADLTAFWRTLDLADAVATRDAVLAFLPALVQNYGEIGAALAADFYEELRDSSAARSVYTAVLPEGDDVVPLAAVQASGRWAMGSLFGAESLEVAGANTLTNLSGVATRQILTPARDVIRLNTARDPDSVGWRRVAQGTETCKFCRMLVGRGNVYSSSSARFAAHDDCDCTAEPAFAGEEWVPLEPVQYMGSKRNPTKADRARVKEFLAGMD